jgi:peptide/nickel transport system permease protein
MAEIEELDDVARDRGLWRRLPRRARACAVVIGLYCAVALWGEAVHRFHAGQDETPAYNRVSLADRHLPPLSHSKVADGAGRQWHLLGTDNLGRDVFQRLVQGTRIAFHVGIVTSVVAVPLGTLLGLLAGFYGRRLDALLSALAATIAAVPAMLFILAIAMVAGKGLLGVYLGISLTTWVGVFRTVRGETMKHRGQGYVQAARVLGYGPGRILFRHLLPNVAHIVIVAFSVRFPAAVSTEVFMSFLGIGVQNEPSWGVMINNARVRLWQGIWWEGASVTVAVFGLVLCFNLLGDALRDALDPTLRRLSD